VRNATGVVTVSVGVSATVPTDAFSSAGLVSATDAALYDAKHLGRDRVARGLLAVQLPC